MSALHTSSPKKVHKSARPPRGSVNLFGPDARDYERRMTPDERWWWAAFDKPLDVERAMKGVLRVKRRR